MVQNLICSGAYLRIIYSSALLQKVLKLVPLTTTVPKVYVATIITVLSYYYYSLVDTMNHNKSLKLKGLMGENGIDFCAAILVYYERLESAGYFKPNYLFYIIWIFEDTSGSRFHLWETQKYKEVLEFIKKLFVYDEYVMQPDDIINMVPMLKMLCMNTVTLLTQIGVNPLIKENILIRSYISKGFYCVHLRSIQQDCRESWFWKMSQWERQ